MELKPGDKLGHYEILSRIGAGGMGEVFRARDPRLRRDVAIKVCATQFSERFEFEARAIAALNHPHICTLYDVGPNFLVMELVEGETLRDRLKRAPSEYCNVEIARQVLEALRAAHRAGLVHRDLKPANIMVRSDGYVKVLDFGLAKRMPASDILQTDDTETNLSRPDQIVGTVSYMSPEQIQGKAVDQRSDLFAFGIILHEMVTGEHPWRRGSTLDTMHAILHDAAPAIDAASGPNAELAPLIRKLLAKNPAERYASAEAVLEALAGRAAAATSTRILTSIAVLPFVFLTDTAERSALSLGFADALITLLGNMEDVAVRPTSAILNLDTTADPAEVCKRLGVRYVLQGNVQKIGARWRVSIHLFDVTTMKTVLAEKHDFELENIFDLQDEIGRRVMDSLQPRFLHTASKSRDRYSSDPEAYGEFMAGLRDSTSNQRETMERSIHHLSSAVERDPGFALAHATLSFMCTSLYFNFDPHRAWIEKAEQHCDRALALDPALPEAHLARSWILWSPEKNFQHAEAIAALEQVLAAQPNFERAHNRMSSICWHIGRMKEARIAHEMACRSNPKTRTLNGEFVDLYSGDFSRAADDAAKLWLDRYPEAVPNAFDFVIYAALLAGDQERARQRLAAALKQLPDDPLILSLQGLLHALSNRSDSALGSIQKALDCPKSFGHIHHAYHQIACVYAVLGDTEKAMAWLERTVDTGFPCWSFFRIDPYLESLRALPAFHSLVAGLERKYSSIKINRL